MARIAAVAVLTVLLAPAPAWAASVRVEISGDPRSMSAALTFEAAAGEANRVTFRQEGDTFLVADEGASLAPGSNCTAAAAGAVRCITASSADFRTGDLGDVVTIVGEPATVITVSGGSGADELHGGDSAELLFGGPGDDTLRGGGASDTLDGDGDGYGITDPGGGRDVLDGGAGRDTATYERRQSPIIANLAASLVEGAAGERDTLVAVEGVTGGTADDLITGDSGPNTLDGGPGADRVSGRDGADRLTGGRGVDIVRGEEGGDEVAATEAGDVADGGPGADFVSAGFSSGAILDAGPGDDRIGLYGKPRSLSCGEGADTVAGNLDGLRVDGCEQVRLSAFDLFAAAVTPQRTRQALRLEIGCRARGTSFARRCRGEVIMRLRRVGHRPLLLGRRRFSVAEARGAIAIVHVRRRARGALQAARRPLIEIQIKGSAWPRLTGPGGVDQTQRISGRWRIRLASR